MKHDVVNTSKKFHEQLNYHWKNQLIQQLYPSQMPFFPFPNIQHNLVVAMSFKTVSLLTLVPQQLTICNCFPKTSSSYNVRTMRFNHTWLLSHTYLGQTISCNSGFQYRQTIYELTTFYLRCCHRLFHFTNKSLFTRLWENTTVSETIQVPGVVWAG